VVVSFIGGEKSIILMIIEKANVTCGFYSSVDTSLSSSINWGSGKSFAMFVNKQDEGLLMGKIQSRHVSSRSHKLWIEYDDVMVLQSTETLKSISL
jgi:hypothetical protein